MSLTLDDNQAKYQIRAYEPGSIRVNDEIYHHSIIIGAEWLIDSWHPETLADLTQDDFNLIEAEHPAILLLGTGIQLQFPALALYGHLINKGIGVEVMTTRSACLTFNALTAENRNVIAALLIK